MKARITLSGVAYDYLYMGTPEEAAAADKSAWIAGVGTVDYTTADGETKTVIQIYLYQFWSVTLIKLMH